MSTVDLGPFAAPLAPLLAIVALLIAALTAGLVGRSRRAGAGATLADMLIAGAVAARIVFVAQWFAIYRQSPWSMLDIRDGGFNVWAGIAAALALGAWRAWRRPVQRVPLAAGLAVGALVWAMLLGALGLLERENSSLPDNALTTLAGAPTTLARLADGKPMVVNLWASWCPPCRREMPVLAAAQQKETGVRFVFVNQGEASPTVQRFLADTRLGITNVLLDPGSSLGRTVGSTALPTTLFYDASGRLADAHFGALSAATLASRLQHLRNPVASSE